MQLERLELTQYRNIEHATIELSPTLTVLVGDNGMGKTNILEAIHLLSFPRSFRGTKDGLLPRWEAEFARAEGLVRLDDGSERQLVVFINPRKKLLVDGQSEQGVAFVGNFLSILFAPEEVDLLAGSPSERRAFLDAHLSQVSRQYFVHLLDYNKVVKQRNKLLSLPGTSRAELEYWDEEMVKQGSALISSRVAAIERFNELLQPSLLIEYEGSVKGGEGVSVEEVGAAFRKKQASLKERERAAGHSLVGPHRDDWRLIEVEPVRRDVGVYGSRGEQRMAVIKLKQAELRLTETLTGQRAVLLLDDVLSELDADNQQRLIKELGGQQSVITTASLSDVPSVLLDEAKVYRVENGRVFEQ